MWNRGEATKAPFVNSSVKEKFDLAKISVVFLESLSYLTGSWSWAAATPVKYDRDTQKINCVLTIVKNREINGTEEIEIDSVTPQIAKYGMQYIR